MCGYLYIGFTDFIIKAENCQIIEIYFLLMNMKRMINDTEIF